jgi:hypothetical protein
MRSSEFWRFSATDDEGFFFFFDDDEIVMTCRGLHTLKCVLPAFLNSEFI